MRLIKVVSGLLASLLLLVAVARADGDTSSRKIVVFSGDTDSSDRVRIASTGGSVVRTLDLINAVVVETPAGTVQANAFDSMKATGKVLRVDDDPKINWLKAVTPVDAWDTRLPEMGQPVFRFERQTPKDVPSNGPSPLPWGILRVDAPAAWAVTKGKGVKVCVIDTGIDPNHPDLKANIAGGWNVIKKTADFTDDNGHGSHVSGTIAAIEDDVNGVVGVAPQASLYGVKVLDQDGSGTFDDVIAGMQWAVDNHMQVASMSLGASQGNDSLAAAVNAMVKAGVVLIAAAGNSGPGDNTVGYPAAYPGVIAVAAMDSNNQIADFSSRGPQVAVAAPGVGVKSTYMNGGFETLDGTSMATPHVSGLAALAIAAKGLSGESAVLAALQAAATPLPGLGPTLQGAGVPDAAKLVQ